MRVADLSSTTASLSLVTQDMTTLENTSQSFASTQYTYNSYESLISLPIFLPTATTGSEFRATLFDGTTEVWHGSIQVFRDQEVDKANYTNQNNQYISNVSQNKYIILD
jgi:hypothetical protein